jgi:hypothetical protein
MMHRMMPSFVRQFLAGGGGSGGSGRRGGESAAPRSELTGANAADFFLGVWDGRFVE